MLQIIRGEISDLPFEVDAIIVSVEPEAEPEYSFGGLDTIVYRAAGENLLAARRKLGKIAVKEVKATKAYNLKNAKEIFHTVIPVWQGGDLRELSMLRECYKNSFSLALKKNFSKIALPILGIDNESYPINDAVRIAIAESVRFLINHDINIILVTFDKDFDICKRIFPPRFIKQYIKNSDVRKIKNADKFAGARESRQSTRNVDAKSLNKTFLQKLADFMQKINLNLDDDKDLMKLIHLGNISDRVKYSIRNAKENGYTPSKKTAVRFAIALKLSLADAVELLNSAGYVLYHGDELDRKLKNFIYHNQDTENYTIEKMESEIPEF